MLATLSISGAVATLTINRPDKANSLSPDLLVALHERADELTACFEGKCGFGFGATDAQAPSDAKPTVCVVTGAGKAFCAGMDLKAVLGNPDLTKALLTSLAELTHKLRALPCVTLAAVNGPAIGGGCGLVTVCDLAVTFAGNKMGFPEVDLGVCPAVVAPWLIRKIGPGQARKVLLQGGLINGATAHELGIVTELVSTQEEVMPAAGKIAERLAAGSLAALKATKGLLNELDGSTDLPLLRRAAELSAEVVNTPETQKMLRSKLGT